MSNPDAVIVVQGSLMRFNSAGVTPTETYKFSINPAFLTRSFEFPLTAAGAADPGGTPLETIRFVLHLDASDQLEAGEAGQVYPNLAALEVLMQPPAPGEPAFLLFTWGTRHIPVRITELKIMERLFDNDLNTLRAAVRVVLTVLNGSSLPDGASPVGEAYQNSVAAAAAPMLTPPFQP